MGVKVGDPGVTVAVLGPDGVYEPLGDTVTLRVTVPLVERDTEVV